MANRAILSVALAVCCFGCAEDGIRHYQALRLEAPKAAGQAHDHDPRLLAAIVPHGDRTWFFKLVGPSDGVAEQAEHFDQFVRSLQFDGARPVSWTLPDGWNEQPGSESRYATIQISSDHPMELTVVPLGREAGTLLDNVNRWRRQMGLEPIASADLGSVTRILQLGDSEVTIVDFTASARRLPAGHPPVAPENRDRGSKKPLVKYTVPDGWKEVPSRSAFRAASLEVASGDERADVSITGLAGSAGGLVANVNRWRSEQLGLPDLDEDELRRSVTSIDVAGTPAHFVELVGAESAGKDRQSILGVIVDRGDQTWFIKMTGPSALLSREKSSFETFVRSITFE
jgi:hypothetical protein